MESPPQYHLSHCVLFCVAVIFTHLQPSTAGDCPADGRTWVPFNQRCYHFVHGEEDKVKSYTFDRAELLCQNFELVTVQSSDENDFIIENSRAFWKGTVNVWLGMYYDTNSEDMKWLGEQAVSFTNWNYNSTPSNLVPVDTCVAMHSNTGKWENVSCLDEVENGVICETAERAVEGKQHPSPLISALVILAVVVIIGISAFIWFLHQKLDVGSTMFTSFEYHPPFRTPSTDQSCLVEAEETEDMP